MKVEVEWEYKLMLIFTRNWSTLFFNLIFSSTCDPQVERLKGGLMQSEQARTKLLEKAKRHVRPRAVYQMV